MPTYNALASMLGLELVLEEETQLSGVSKDLLLLVAQTIEMQAKVLRALAGE